MRYGRVFRLLYRTAVWSKTRRKRSNPILILISRCTRSGHAASIYARSPEKEAYIKDRTAPRWETISYARSPQLTLFKTKPYDNKVSPYTMTNASKPVYTLPDDAVWLITGCSSGLGLSLAQLIAAHPTQRIVATARNSDRLKPLLPSNNPRVLLVELDVTSTDSITQALDRVLTHPLFGRIDALGLSCPLLRALRIESPYF